MAVFAGKFVYGDTQKALTYEVRDRETGNIVDLTTASNAKFYARAEGKRVLACNGVTATMGGAAGTISIVPGAQSGLAPGDMERLRFEIWFEFDLSGKHWNVPDDGHEVIEVVDLR